MSAPKPAAPAKVVDKAADDKRKQFAERLPNFPYQSLGRAEFSNVRTGVKVTIPFSATIDEIQRKGSLEERVIRRLLHQQLSSVSVGVKRASRPADDQSSDDDETGASSTFNRNAHNSVTYIEDMIVGITGMKAQQGHSQAGAALTRKVSNSHLIDFRVEVVVTTATVLFGLCAGSLVAAVGPYPMTVSVDVLTVNKDRLTILVSSNECETLEPNAPMLVTVEPSCLRAQAFTTPSGPQGVFRITPIEGKFKTEVSCYVERGDKGDASPQRFSRKPSQ